MEQYGFGDGDRYGEPDPRQPRPSIGRRLPADERNRRYAQEEHVGSCLDRVMNRVVRERQQAHRSRARTRIQSDDAKEK